MKPFKTFSSIMLAQHSVFLSQIKLVVVRVTKISSSLKEITIPLVHNFISIQSIYSSTMFCNLPRMNKGKHTLTQHMTFLTRFLAALLLSKDLKFSKQSYCIDVNSTGQLECITWARVR